MKVIVTQILMFVLWVFIFIRTILSSTSEDQIINGGLLLISVVVGTLLIKSVMREVQQREEIQKLADDLKLANQGQSSLMHFMNHQVKGRLGNVKNIFAELLTDDYGEMPRDAKPLLEKGLDEADIGVNYVQNILKGASAENGTLPYDMKPIDLKSLVTTAFEKQKDRAEKKELKFELKIEDGNYEMTGDAVQLGESIRNLIDNSLNYTPEGSVVVSLSNNSHIYRIEIKDTGVGLSSEDKLKLFKSGGRGEDSLKINVNSTGYGLVFVKGVVSAHGGKVWAESEGRGKGSTFIVELPKK
jgi:signal transduction histidine kinase